MATSNFNHTNILFVGGSDCDDEFICQDTINNVEYELKSIFKASQYDWIDGTLYNERDTGGDGRVLALFKVYENESDCLDIQLVVRSGYYEGFNFDLNYNQTRTVKDDSYYVCEELENDSIELCETNQLKLERVQRKIEKALRVYTTELVKLGTLSSGEAVYKKKAA